MNLKQFFSICLSGIIWAGQALAESPPKQIAQNASTMIYASINKSGIDGAVSEIKQCYDQVKSRDHFVYCMSMDIQASRFDAAVSKKSGLPAHDFFLEANMDQRVQVLQRWYTSTSQLDYVMKQVMDGLEAGTKQQLARVQSLNKEK